MDNKLVLKFSNGSKLITIPMTDTSIRGNRSKISWYIDYPCTITKQNRKVFYKYLTPQIK